MKKAMKPKRLRVPEKSVEHAIITRLQTNGFSVHKLDTQSMAGRTITYEKNGKVSTRRYVDPTAVVGQPDLIAVKPWASADLLYRVLYIETKAKDGKLSTEQKSCHAVMRKQGYVVLVPRSEQEFVDAMEELGVMLR